MKQILLMRHAKSSRDDAGLKDIDRPLAKRGKKDAPAMGSFLRKGGYIPAEIIASPAERVRQTVQLLVKSAQLDEEMVRREDQLYYGKAEQYLEAIQSADATTERVMLVGHNPLLESAVGLLTGSPTKPSVRMPTAALVCLEGYAESWEYITPGSCQIKWMMIPKLLHKVWGDLV